MKRRTLVMPFEIVGGQAIPRLPRDRDGAPRRIDGKRFLSAEQCGRRLRRSVKRLRDLWEHTWADLLTPPDAKIVFGLVQKRDR